MIIGNCFPVVKSFVSWDEEILLRFPGSDKPDEIMDAFGRIFVRFAAIIKQYEIKLSLRKLPCSIDIEIALLGAVDVEKIGFYQLPSTEFRVACRVGEKC